MLRITKWKKKNLSAIANVFSTRAKILAGCGSFQSQKSVFCPRNRNFHSDFGTELISAQITLIVYSKLKPKASEWWTKKNHSLHWENCDLHKFETNN